MKQLSQAVFDGQSEEWKYAAVNKNGAAWLYKVKPSVSWSDPVRFVTNRIGLCIGIGYDATDWENSAVRREGVATKQLTQAVFEGMPKWIKSARIDKKGKLVVYSLNAATVTRILNNEILLPWNCGIWDSGYDTTDWQNSAIDREASK